MSGRLVPLPPRPGTTAPQPAAAPRADDPRGMVHLAADLGKLGAWAWDVGSPHVHCSRQACSLLGLVPGEAVPTQALLDRFTEEHAGALKTAFLRCVMEGRPFDIEAEVIQASGARLWVRVLCEPEWDRFGHVVRMHGALQDVTPARQVHLALQESRRALATLVGNLPGLAYRCGNTPDWPMDYASEGALALTGYTAQELVAGRPTYGSLMHPADVLRVWDAVQLALARGERFQVEYRLRCADGSQKWVCEQGVGVHDADGSLRCIEGFVHDVTPRRQAREQLADLNRHLEDRVAQRTAALEAAMADLEALAYSIGHDLRAPLAALAGFSRVLQAELPDLPQRHAHFLQRIVHNAGHMTALTEGLLALARMSAHDLRREPVDLTAIAQRQLAQLREQEPQRPVDACIEAGLHATGDPRLLEQLLANLLANAWKFSRDKPVATIRVGSAPGEDGATVFHVQDQGAGFDMAHADALFQPFRRLHRDSEFDGTGIGLALARRIVQRHGGRIWGRGEPGVGATFCFTLGG